MLINYDATKSEGAKMPYDLIVSDLNEYIIIGCTTRCEQIRDQNFGHYCIQRSVARDLEAYLRSPNPADSHLCFSCLIGRIPTGIRFTRIFTQSKKFRSPCLETGTQETTHRTDNGRNVLQILRSSVH